MRTTALLRSAVSGAHNALRDVQRVGRHLLHDLLELGVHRHGGEEGASTALFYGYW